MNWLSWRRIWHNWNANHWYVLWTLPIMAGAEEQSAQQWITLAGLTPW
jgi:hypothetical protein